MRLPIWRQLHVIEHVGLRWLKTVSSAFQDLDFDGSLGSSKDCPIIGEHIGSVFVTL